jgi:hypothetical protein
MACAYHPERAEATLCSGCSRPCCEDCFVVLAGRALCAACKETTLRRLLRGEPLSDRDRGPSPWERRPGFPSFKETLRLTMLQPQEFFASLSHSGPPSYLGYTLLAAWPSTFLGQLFWLLIQAALVAAAPNAGGEGVAAALGMFGVMAGAYCVMTPIGIMMQVFVGGAITHVCLKAVGGANAPLEATLRVVAYAQSPQILAVVPLLGGLAAWGWGLVAQIVGLKEMHETDYARVVVAAFLPLLVCCAVLVPLIAVIVLLEQAK